MSFALTFSSQGDENVRSPDIQAPPTSGVMPAWLFVEGRVSGICKQSSQITTPPTTNVIVDIG